MNTERKEQGTTRVNILQLLRRHGQMTALELSDALGIGAVGIRQHLALLERDGMVRISGLRRSVGRPSHLYILTEEAEHHFPKQYDQIALDLLNYIAKQGGDQAVAQAFQTRRQLLAHRLAPRLIGKTRAEQVAELARILTEQGYMSECEELEDGSFQLIEYNCPVDCIARQHGQICAEELELYQELFGLPIVRDSTIAQGGLCCRYLIPA